MSDTLPPSPRDGVRRATSRPSGFKGILSFTQPSRSVPEARWVWQWALLAIFITCLPYLFALAVAVPNRFFIGHLHYPDDAYVYLSWMRQAQDGRITFVNRFTSLPQEGGFFNLYFLFLGNVSRFTGLSTLVVFHLARVLFGLAFLIHAYRLLRHLLPDESERKTAFLLLCFSAGVGWAFPRLYMGSPVDLWQTEANTFISLYLFPLFSVALWLMALTFERLWAARQTGRLAPAVAAGVSGLLLANIHSYDILIVWAVWAAFLLSLLFTERKLNKSDLYSAALLYLMPLPAVWQQYRFFKTDPVFHNRVLVETLSPAFYWYLLGLGLLVPLGLYGAWSLRRRTERMQPVLLFLLTWAVLGLLLPYVPLSFQRKLAMGIHIPWAILTGVGGAQLAARWKVPWKTAVSVGVMLTALTQIRWFHLALINIESNTTETMGRVFLANEEMAAIRWLSRNAEGQAVLAAPMPFGGVAGYLPGLAGVSTFAGHWGETPDFKQKVSITARFYSAKATDEERRAFLRQANIRYVYYSPVERAMVQLMDGNPSAPSPAADLTQMAGLRLVSVSGEGEDAVMIFRVE